MGQTSKANGWDDPILFSPPFNCDKVMLIKSPLMLGTAFNRDVVINKSLHDYKKHPLHSKYEKLVYIACTIKVL